MIIVSACLAGQHCNYKGKDTPCPQVMRLVHEGKAVPVCPEVLGGLSIPRPACEQQADGSITTQEGENMTAAFLKGAKKAVAFAKKNHCTTAILKAHSPSCGYGEVYDGTFSHTVISGNGVFAQRLLDEGIRVMRDEDLPGSNVKSA